MIRHLLRKPEPLPFLILTLRRTGGTALTGALSKASPFPAAWHEPLNPSRKLGQITTRFMRDPAECGLHRELQQALSERPNIKHCIDTVPTSVTGALIEVCTDLGYGIVLLSRRDERRRLRSLAIARATGIWGPRQADLLVPQILSREVVPAPVNLKELRRDCSRAEAALGVTVRFLRHRNLSADWWIFEEIYETKRAPREIVPDLARRFHLSLRPGMASLDRLETSRTDTKPLEDYIPRLDEADHLLKRLVTI